MYWHVCHELVQMYVPAGKPLSRQYYRVNSRVANCTIRHFIEENGRFAKAFQEMPASYLWSFRPKAFEDENSRGNADKTIIRALVMETKYGAMPDLAWYANAARFLGGRQKTQGPG
ncbi:MAG: hypothetical protein V2B20_16680 [Pseudomonadota bacterium]